MQTLHGVRCSDRITVEERKMGFYQGLFDGEEIGQPQTHPRLAVRQVTDWLKQRQKQREEDARREAERDAQAQYDSDQRYLEKLGELLGLNGAAERLVEIAVRRAKS